MLFIADISDIRNPKILNDNESVEAEFNDMKPANDTETLFTAAMEFKGSAIIKSKYNILGNFEALHAYQTFPSFEVRTSLILFYVKKKSLFTLLERIDLVLLIITHYKSQIYLASFLFWI